MLFALRAETIKQYGELRRYWLDHLAVPVEFAFVFYGLLLLMIRPGAPVTPEGVYHLMLGLVLWFLGSMALRDFSGFIMEDAANGTLEQLLLGPCPLWVVLAARSIVSLGLWLGFAVPVAGLGWFLVPSANEGLAAALFPAWCSSIVVLVITLIGAYAFGILLGALTMVYKRVTGYVDVLHYLLLFLTGILYPVEEYPAVLEQFGYLLPLTWGVKTLRELVVEQSSLARLASEGTLWWLCVSTIGYLVLAYAGHLWAFRQLLRRGSIRHW
jgi:ABC-type polysaccharide/polyol phosphate export permease